MNQSDKLNQGYQVGDWVVYSSTGAFNFRGKVVLVVGILSDDIKEKLKKILGYDPSKHFKKRDPEFKKYPIYIVESQSSIEGKPPTFAECKGIIPSMTKEQHDLLFKLRRFVCIDSDLLPLYEGLGKGYE